MLQIIVFTLFTALLLNIFLKRFGLPTIIGYILTGTIIAYGFGLHDVVNNHELKEIAEFGVVFLMFTIGLEFSIQQLKRMRNEVFVTGSLQIGITTLVVFLLAYYLFDISSTTSLILALAIALSSTAIVLKTFNESGEINRRYGQRALGILIMQDIAVIPILLLIGFLANSEQDLGYILMKMAVSAVVLLFTLWFIGRFLLEPFFATITKTRSEELFIGSILFLAIGASYFAHVLGFSYSLGAFIAGMLIAETRYRHQTEADLIPFRDLLLGIFFITVGMQIDFIIIADYIHIIILLLSAVIALKFLIIFVLIRLNESPQTSIKSALSLVQIGEFSLALLELARTNSLIGPPYGQVMIITIVLSMILTPLILKNLSYLSGIFLKKNVEPPPVADYSAEGLNNHVIILGFGEFGQTVAKALKKGSIPYIAIENRIDPVITMQAQGEPVIFGNALKKEILHKVKIDKASHIIIAIDDAKKLYLVCETIIKMADSSKLIVKVHSKTEKQIVDGLNIGTVVIENEITSHTILEEITATI